MAQKQFPSFKRGLKAVPFYKFLCQWLISETNPIRVPIGLVLNFEIRWPKLGAPWSLGLVLYFQSAHSQAALHAQLDLMEA